MTWNEYQKSVADFFISIGAEAKIDAIVNGVRGVHRVDVLVSLTHFGINILWIIECKFWKTSIPKEKVLTLQQIVQDIGADRGLLMSESGFQSGAIRCTQSSNITLSSLNELKDIAKEELLKTRLKSISHKLQLLTDRYHSFIPWSDFFYCRPAHLIENSLPSLFTIRSQFFRAMNNDFPIHLYNSTVNNIEDFINNCTTIFCNAEEEIILVEKEYNDNIGKNLKFYKSLKADTLKLSQMCGDIIVNHGNLTEQDRIRTKALKIMKRIGDNILKIKACTNNRSYPYFQNFHRIIIDQLYLDLANENLEVIDVGKTKENLERAYKSFEKVFQPINNPPAP